MAEKTRDSIPPDERKRLAGQCFDRLVSLEAYSNTELLYCYISFRSEMPTGDIINLALAEGSRVAVPRIEGKKMAFYEIRSLSDLSPGTWGIPEPDGRGPDLHEPGLAIVPGLAFDEDLYRMGYGGGFYDRFISQHPHILPVGIAFERQVYPQLPREDHDCRMQILVTDAGIRMSRDEKG